MDELLLDNLTFARFCLASSGKVMNEERICVVKCDSLNQCSLLMFSCTYEAAIVVLIMYFIYFKSKLFFRPQPYGTEVFETQSIDWFSGLVDDRTMPSTLGSLSDYSNLDSNEERSNGFDLQQRNNHYSIYHETSSSELDHGPDLDNSELEIDVKSFYSQENFYSQGLNTADALIDFKTEKIKTERNADYLMKCSEEEALGLSDRDSESGMCFSLL